MIHLHLFGSITSVCFLLILSGGLLTAQTSNFQDGTTQGWGNGGGSNAPVVVPSGGPRGTDDAYLRVTADGDGSGGRLVVFNGDEWAGNYQAAEIQTLRMDAVNLGDQPITLRIALDGTGQRLITDDSFLLPPDSTWYTLEFSIAADRIVLTGDLDSLLSNVTLFRIVHAEQPAFPPPFIEAVLGLDNITTDGELVAVNTTEPSVLPRLSLTPNPVPSGTSISVNIPYAKGTLCLSDRWGRTHLVQPARGPTITLPTRDLPAGIYYLQWHSGDAYTVDKVVIF